MEIKWVHPSVLKPHPKNNNKHTPEQIERLARLLRYQGQRTPIVVSNLSGFIVKGHATLEAIRANGVNTVAVTYQDFEDEAQEYAYLTSDNAIAAWASIDMDAVYATVESLDIPDVDVLGFQNYDAPIFNEPAEKKDPEEKEAQLATCPNCGVLIDG